MKYEMERLKDILNNLKEDPMRVIYTEHYLDQIAKRNIPDMCIEELIKNGKLAEITEIQNSTFELHFNLDDSNELFLIIQPFNRNSIILISATSKNNAMNDSSKHVLEFEGIYDSAFDLMDLHSRYGFKYNQTIEMERGFNIDFDSGDHPVAIEIFQASKRYKVNRKTFSTATFDGKIEITQDLIKIRLKATFDNENIGARVFEREIPNEYGIQENVFDLKFEKTVS